MSTKWRSSIRATPTRIIIRRPCSRSTPVRRAWVSPAWGRGSRMDWGPKRRICRRSSSCTTLWVAAFPKGTPRTGARAFCRVFTRERPSDRRERRSTISSVRRMVERGVRFVQIYSGGMDNELSWDGHADIKKNHSGFAAETDQPIAGLLADLESRGLLDSTLVIWGGEFGRLPIVQKGGTGRDHNPHAFTYWLAGGGVKGGTRHGKTDEIGHKAVEDKVSVHDLHATILRLMGLDHTLLT